MKKLCFIFCVFAIFSGQIYAAERCYSKMSEVLDCFLKHDDGVYKYEFLSEESSNNPNVTIKTYILHSQQWPIGDYQDIPSTVWQHKLVFYIPKKIFHNKALLYVNGGRNRDDKGFDEFLSPKEHINYVKIAANNKVVVVELQDVPNQFLFVNNRFIKEDQILAYTYKKVMADPLQDAYLAGHLPMAKAVIKAMDAVQEILGKEAVTSFILSGASKRGWAVWLAALGDERVVAIIPIIINVLNAQKSIIHTCRSYGGICPPALQDYEAQGITAHLSSPAFAMLMGIEDPYSYLQEDYDKRYKSRLAIPKYIINASGDDFFVPDSSRWYFKNLPGENNYIRYLPNAMHSFAGNLISDSTDSLRAVNEALDVYSSSILNNIALPKVSWEFNSGRVELKSSLKPNVVKVWVSNNEHARDFRFITSYQKLHLMGKKVRKIFSLDLCDNCYTEKIVDFVCEENYSCEIEVQLPAFTRGWQASFVELLYNINGANFVVTTEVNIEPDTMPVAVDAGYQEL